MQIRPNVDLNDIVLFFEVASRGSLSAAARALDIPKSTVSQRISALERTLGTALLRRTSRSQSLTDAGEKLLPYAREIQHCIRRAEQELADTQTSVSGSLRLTCSVAVSQFALAALLPDFLKSHPLVTVKVDVTNRYTDLVGEGYDLALRAHTATLDDSSLRQRVVLRTPWCLAAAPSWLASNRPPTKPDELRTKETLFFQANRAPFVWSLMTVGSMVEVALRPRIVCDDMATLRSVAIGGAGIVALPAYILGPTMRAGLLEPVLRDWSLPPSVISMLSPPAGQSSPLAQAFSEYLTREIGRPISDWIQTSP